MINTVDFKAKKPISNYGDDMMKMLQYTGYFLYYL